jgi:hypothetical protein
VHATLKGKNASFDIEDSQDDGYPPEFVEENLRLQEAI